MVGGHSSNDHFLPRLLLRGFASRTKGRKARVWLFRRDQAPVEPSIGNVATERDFHGTGSIEAKLSKEETRYGVALDRIRQGEDPAPWQPVLAELVSQLVIRTKNTREGVAAFGWDMLDVMERAFVDRGHLTRGVMAQMVRDRRVRTLLRHAPPAQRAEIVRRMQKFESDLPGIGRAFFEYTRRRIDFDTMAKEKQLATLESPTADVERTRRFAEFTWSVFDVGSPTLVLGDVGPLALGGGSDEFVSPIALNKMPTRALLLPLTPRLLLVGHEAAPPTIQPESLNVASAEMSREFFVASANTSREQALHARIGARPRIVSTDDLEASLADRLG